MNIHYLQHVPFEGLGTLEQWAIAQQHHLSCTLFFEASHQLPDPAEVDLLIIMGGPMGVYDEALYPWLGAEKQFIQRCIALHKKTLGICLGAQLLAHCLGATIRPAAHREIGWYPVSPTADSKALGWFQQLFSASPQVFHWHGDQFDIPEGAVHLLRSEANENQAFAHGTQVLGLQFHVEAATPQVELMLAHGADELVDAPHIQSRQEIIRGAQQHSEGCYALLSTILEQWI